jgi:hypothetical protein
MVCSESSEGARTVKNMTLSIAVAVLSIAGSTAALAAELPTYEANGFPAGHHRFSPPGERPDAADENEDRDGRAGHDGRFPLS